MALLSPKQHIPCPRLLVEANVVAKDNMIVRLSQPRMTWCAAMPRPLELLGTKVCVVAKLLLIARHSRPRMTWDAAMARTLECCTFLPTCQMKLNELWIAMCGLASTSTTHSKPKAMDKGSYVVAQHLLIAKLS